MFPKNVDRKDIENALSIQLFGKRFYKDQTLGEYFLEFLLVFVSAKSLDGSGKLEFHTAEQVERGGMIYVTIPRNGIKRFVFYDRSRIDSRSDIDQDAYDRMMKMLEAKSEDPDWPYMLQDLLYGYASVLKNRGWYAQFLLPICPELVFPETLGIKKRQSQKTFNTTELDTETMFDYSEHDFMARGGEIYYLHLLQGIYEDDDSKTARARLEKGLKNMLRERASGFSMIAENLQSWWLEVEGIDKDERKLQHTMKLGYLQDGMNRRAKFSVDELTRFLSNEIYPISRIELMTKGIMLTLLRVMHLQAHHLLYGADAPEPIWIIDMRSGTASSNVGKLAQESYRNAYDTIVAAINKLAINSVQDADTRFSTVLKNKSDTADVFKKMGKEIALIIPPNGAYERFSLSEDLIKYLVMALIDPSEKLTVDTFLDRLYERYGIVIAPDQYRRASAQLDADMTGYLDKNLLRFQTFLKSCGYLRDLSDATSIVENPCKEVIEQ